MSMSRVVALLAALALAGCVEQGVFPGGPPPSPAFDGAYSGTGRILVNGDFSCRPDFPVARLTIVGGIARFDSFVGTAGADGTLRMVSRGVWITGGFRDGHFTGRVEQSADDVNPIGPSLGLTRRDNCIYELTLERAGG
jgi:hypothetical protein